MARWPGGPVARWPGGPVARWPGGPVARWPGGPVDEWPVDEWPGVMITPKRRLSTLISACLIAKQHEKTRSSSFPRCDRHEGYHRNLLFPSLTTRVNF